MESNFSEEQKAVINCKTKNILLTAREFKDEVIKFDIDVDKDLKIIHISVNFFGETYIGKGFLEDNIKELERERKELVEIDNLIFQDSNLPERMSWKSACEYCEKLKLAGLSDWRLPNIDELKIAYNYNGRFQNIENDIYWSILQLNSTLPSAQFMHFRFGSVGGGHQTLNNYVRCVRSL